MHWIPLQRTVPSARIFTDGMRNVLDMWIGVAPVVMAFGTVALILAEYTGVFTFLGKPFEPILTVLGIPEAAEAAQTMVVGFADMFLPVILAEGFITSQITLFTIATISVVQLIYMSEVGGLILGTKIPINILGFDYHFPIAYAHCPSNRCRRCTFIVLIMKRKDRLGLQA